MRSSLVVTDSRIWTAETEYAVAVAAAEARMGAKVALAAPEGSAVAERDLGAVEFVPLPGQEPSRSPADFVASARAVAAVVRRGCDVVHSSRPTAHLMAAAAVGRRVPLVHLRGSASRPSGSAANRFLYRRVTDAVVVSSGRVRDWVVDVLGVPPSHVRRLFSPVDTRRFTDVPPADLVSELGLAEGARIVTNVARLAPVKGHYVLLEAMARVVSDDPAAALVLVGEPWSGEPEGLKRRACELGIDSSVFFAGRRDDVPSILAASSVCVTSSVGSEENSRAVSEYMAAARPVVATDVGVIPELVRDGETGLVVKPNDADALAGAILALLADRESADRMGSRGRQVAGTEFSQEAFVEGLESVLTAAGVGG